MPPKLLLFSNSTQHGQKMFEWCADFIKSFLEKSNVNTILFVPYAVKDYDSYYKKVAAALNKIGINVESIHEKSDPVLAVNNCKGILIGGGNTFLLLKTLYDNQLIEPIRESVLNRGIPYIGASAGTNVSTKSINTTNDMPICFPPSFDALNLLPFNINPHYIDADPNSKHMGETREKRIKEYLEQPKSAPVLGLREGSGILVEDGKITLIGSAPAKLFEKGKDATVYEPGSDMSFLLNSA